MTIKKRDNNEQVKQNTTTTFTVIKKNKQQEKKETTTVVSKTKQMQKLLCGRSWTFRTSRTNKLLRFDRQKSLVTLVTDLQN